MDCGQGLKRKVMVWCSCSQEKKKKGKETVREREIETGKKLREKAKDIKW